MIKKGDIVRCIYIVGLPQFVEDGLYRVIRAPYYSGNGQKLIGVEVWGNSVYVLASRFVETELTEPLQSENTLPPKTLVVTTASEETMRNSLKKEEIMKKPEDYLQQLKEDTAHTNRVTHSQYPTDLVEQLKGKQFICVTGQSRSGKDTFVDLLGEVTSIGHYRFGDTMKEIAHQVFDNFPSPYNKEGWSTEARKEKRFNGLNLLEVLIQCVDPLRKADPYIFIKHQLHDMIVDGMDTIVVSGCRTTLGLELMKDLGATFVRIERPGLEQAPGATMDDVQMNWPVHWVVQNDSDILNLKDAAKWIWNEMNTIRTEPSYIRRGER